MVAGKLEFAVAVPLLTFCSLPPRTLARMAQETVVTMSKTKTTTTVTTIPEIAPTDRFVMELEVVGLTAWGEV